MLVLVLLLLARAGSVRANVGVSDVPDNDITTSFQTNSPYDPNLDLKTGEVIPYVDGAGATWNDKGYRVGCMLSISHDWSGAWVRGELDGRQHFDLVQTRADGSHAMIGNGYYMVPTDEWIAVLKAKIEKAIAEGAVAIYPEEPEFWANTGYSPAFKAEWEKFYGEPWQDPASSLEARYKCSRLQAEFYRRCVEELARFVKERWRNVRFILPAHSNPNYTAWGIVFPHAAALLTPGVDGVVGQVWSDTARTPVPYYGRKEERTFESAFLGYSYFAQLARGSGKEMWFLADPKSDDPAARWNDCKRRYQETLFASLMFPEVNRFEVIPWPDRVFGWARDASGSPASRDYLTEVLSAFAAQADMQDHYGFEWLASTEGIGLLTSDTSMWQRAEPEVTPTDAFYGLALPLLTNGVPVQVVPVERIAEPGYLGPFRVLLASFEMWKPLEAAYLEALENWVRGGGVLIYWHSPDPYQQVPGWWSSQYKTPEEALLAILKKPGVESLGARQWHTYRVGQGGFIYVPTPASETTKFGARSESVLEVVQEACRGWQAAQRGGTRQPYGVEPRFPAVPGYLAARRGPYLIAFSRASGTTLRGRFLNLLDPRLTPLQQARVGLGQGCLLLDLDGLPRSTEVLFVSGKLEESRREGEETVLRVSGPLNTRAAVRLAGLGRYPVSARADFAGGTEDIAAEWDAESRTLLLLFPHHPEGVEIRVGWAAEPADAIVVAPPENVSREIILVPDGGPVEKRFLTETTGPAQLGKGYRFADREGSFTYTFDLQGLTEARVELDLGNNFVVEASTDGANWQKVFDAMAEAGRDVHDLSNRARRALDLMPYQPAGSVRLRFRDGSPADGWGAWLAEVRFLFRGSPSPANSVVLGAW